MQQSRPPYYHLSRKETQHGVHNLRPTPSGSIQNRPHSHHRSNATFSSSCRDQRSNVEEPGQASGAKGVDQWWTYHRRGWGDIKRTRYCETKTQGEAATETSKLPWAEPEHVSVDLRPLVCCRRTGRVCSNLCDACMYVRWVPTPSKTRHM